MEQRPAAADGAAAVRDHRPHHGGHRPSALWLLGFERDLWLTFAWLAPVSFLRTLSSVVTVVLPCSTGMSSG